MGKKNLLQWRKPVPLLSETNLNPLALTMASSPAGQALNGSHPSTAILTVGCPSSQSGEKGEGQLGLFPPDYPATHVIHGTGSQYHWDPRLYPTLVPSRWEKSQINSSLLSVIPPHPPSVVWVNTCGCYRGQTFPKSRKDNARIQTDNLTGLQPLFSYHIYLKRKHKKTARYQSHCGWYGTS